MTLGREWYPLSMKLMKSVAMAGIAKKLYDESRKPHNQAKIKQAVAKAKSKRGR